MLSSWIVEIWIGSVLNAKHDDDIICFPINEGNYTRKFSRLHKAAAFDNIIYDIYSETSHKQASTGPDFSPSQ